MPCRWTARRSRCMRGRRMWRWWPAFGSASPRPSSCPGAMASGARNSSASRFRNRPKRPRGGLDGLLQSLQRLEQLGLAGQRRLALFALLLDDLLGRVGNELLVGQLGLGALDVGVGLADLLVETRALGSDVDHSLQRQRGHFATHEEL